MMQKVTELTNFVKALTVPRLTFKMPPWEQSPRDIRGWRNPTILSAPVAAGGNLIKQPFDDTTAVRPTMAKELALLERERRSASAQRKPVKKSEQAGETGMGKLTGRNVVITGAAGGIGLATAKLFLAEGANLLLVDREPMEPIERPDDLADAKDSRWITVQADLSVMSELDKITVAARDAWDKIDVYFACAGIIKIQPLGAITEEVYDRHMAVNLKAVVFGIQNVLPMMSEGASIVLMSSCMAEMGAPGYSPYGATKAAVRSLARNWSLDLRDRNIRVNALMPGGIETPLLQDSLPDDNKEVSENLLPRIPMHRIGQPEEVAQAALFLASAASSYMTGTGLSVDGGIGQV